MVLQIVDTISSHLKVRPVARLGTGGGQPQGEVVNSLAGGGGEPY